MRDTRTTTKISILPQNKDDKYNTVPTMSTQQRMREQAHLDLYAIKTQTRRPILRHPPPRPDPNDALHIEAQHDA